MATLQRGRKLFADSLPEITNIREVSRADLSHLTQKREAGYVQTLRDNHHRIARALASGMTNIEVAATCGIAVNSVSRFKADPTCADLIAHYRGILTAEWAQQDTVVEYLRSNALKAQAMLSDKLDEAAEKNEFLPTRDLLGIAELGLDRTGYGKVNKNLNVNVDFAARLEAARTRSDAIRATREIEGEVLPPVPASPRSAPETSTASAPRRIVSPSLAPPIARRV